MNRRYDRPLQDRVISSLEDGYGNEGPLAKTVAFGLVAGCLVTVTAITLGVIVGVVYLAIRAIQWLN